MIRMLKTAAGNAVSAAEESKRRNIRYHSLTALYQKEMADHVTSKRFIIILTFYHYSDPCDRDDDRECIWGGYRYQQRH